MYIFGQMPILPSAPNLDNSPWYEIMETKGAHWNQFAKEVNSNIQGSYNADLLEFKMVLSMNGLDVHFYGRRDLKSTTNLLIPTNGKIVEHLHIRFKKSTFRKDHLFYIYKMGFWNEMRALFRHYTIHTRKREFMIRHNSKSFINAVLNFNVLSYNGLQNVQSTRKRFDLVLSYLPSEPQALHKILDFVGRMAINK